jgi:hypothetical protein
MQSRWQRAAEPVETVWREDADGFLMAIQPLGDTSLGLGFLGGAGEGNQTLVISLEDRCGPMCRQIHAGRERLTILD